jgi:hypothetical protein
MEAPIPGSSTELVGSIREQIETYGLSSVFTIRYEADGDRVALVRVGADGTERAIRYPADQSCVALIADFLRIESRLVSVRRGTA